MSIVFNCDNPDFRLKKKSILKEWINLVAKKEKRYLGNIHFIFMNDEELFKINKEFLKHETYTDIITFDYGEKDKIEGEIYISTERVNDNAVKLGLSFDTELHRVIIHGILHLIGYKDKTKNDSDKMRRKENDALRLLNELI